MKSNAQAHITFLDDGKCRFLRCNGESYRVQKRVEQVISSRRKPTHALILSPELAVNITKEFIKENGKSKSSGYDKRHPHSCCVTSCSLLVTHSPVKIPAWIMYNCTYESGISQLTVGHSTTNAIEDQILDTII